MNHTGNKDNNEKAGKIRRQPKRESTLIPTFTAMRHSSGDLEQGEPHHHDFLQRRCLCGKHTNGDGEGEEIQPKREQPVVTGHQWAGGAEGAFQVHPGVESRIQQMDGSGQALPDEERDFFESRMGHDFSDVRVHTDASAIQASRDINARAFTVGNNIAFSDGAYQPGQEAGRRLLAHELTHVLQQTQARPLTKPNQHQVQRTNNEATSVPSVMRNEDGQSNLDRLDEMLDRFNVPENDVITLLGKLSPTEKTRVLTGGYQSRIASALNIGEMVRAVRNLDPDLAVQLRWVEAAASYRSQIDYADIQTLVTGAEQPERDALKSATWRNFFVDVCTNRTMRQAVVDLRFDLPTKLRWIHAELGNVTAELNYSDIQSIITGSPQPERDLLHTNAWRDWFVQVTTNATMAQLVVDLGLDLKTQIRWMIAEGTSYSLVKTRITAADPAQKPLALRDQTFLREIKAAFSWDDFAKCVELLGRLPPTGNEMKVDPHVTTGMTVAWTASNPAVTLWPAANPAHPGSACNPPAGYTPPANVHEEGGFIYFNIITGTMSVRAVAAGGQASLPLNNPPTVDDSIVVGGYHTHPNVGNCWGAPFFSPEDIAWSSRNGVPILMRGAHPTVANTSDHATGTARQHLAGSRGFPGASGGIAPQATADGQFDEL